MVSQREQENGWKGQRSRQTEHMGEEPPRGCSQPLRDGYCVRGQRTHNYEAVAECCRPLTICTQHMLSTLCLLLKWSDGACVGR